MKGSSPAGSSPGTVTLSVNGLVVNLPPGATVRLALVAAHILEDMAGGKRVYDRWGNEVGLDGAVLEGMEIHVR